MKNFIFLGFCALSFNLVNAQVNAITETGDEVILYEDGSWKYKNEEPQETHEIKVNEEEFQKDSKSSFLVKSQKLNVGIWINPKKWNFTKEEEGGAREYQFQKKADDVYGLLISEKFQIPIESLKEIAFQNAKEAAQDAKIIKEEYRTINGKELLMMQMSGTIQGIKFTYFGYYFSNENGSIQLLSYTGSNLFRENKKEMETFLNGLVEL